MAKVQNHVADTVDNLRDSDGNVHEINAAYLDGKDIDDIIPNKGEVKTRNRVSNKGYTGSATWYYPLLKLPVDNAGNYASAIVSGRIGGWVASNRSFCQFLIWNRDGEGITCLHRDGKGATSGATGIADLVLYRNSDSTSTVYIKCSSYFTYDLDIQTYQSSASIIYDGEYSTTTPTGTLKVSGAAATTRFELSKDGAIYNGNPLVLKSELESYQPKGNYQPAGDYQPKGNYATIDTAQIITGEKDFNVVKRHSFYLYSSNSGKAIPVSVRVDGTLYVNTRDSKTYSWDIDYTASWKVVKSYDQSSQQEVSSWHLTNSEFKNSNSKEPITYLLQNVAADSDTRLKFCAVVGNDLKPQLDSSCEPSDSPSELDNGATQQTTGTITATASGLLDIF